MRTFNAKGGVVGAVVAILAITILELPSPVGFETRPQNNVSLVWLVFFLVILVTEIATIPLIFKNPKLGKRLGITAGVLNILQVIADQTHMMQPEAVPLGYSILEGAAVVSSVVLIYFCLKVKD